MDQIILSSPSVNQKKRRRSEQKSCTPQKCPRYNKTEAPSFGQCMKQTKQLALQALLNTCYLAFGRVLETNVVKEGTVELWSLARTSKKMYEMVKTRYANNPNVMRVVDLNLLASSPAAPKLVVVPSPHGHVNKSHRMGNFFIPATQKSYTFWSEMLANNSLSVIRHFGPQFARYTTKKNVVALVARGSIRILQYIATVCFHDWRKLLMDDSLGYYSVPTVIWTALSRSNLRVTKWIIHQYRQIPATRLSMNDCIRTACKSGHLPTVKWLHKRGAELAPFELTANPNYSRSPYETMIDDILSHPSQPWLDWFLEVGLDFTRYNPTRCLETICFANYKWLVEKAGVPLESLVNGINNMDCETIKWLLLQCGSQFVAINRQILISKAIVRHRSTDLLRWSVETGGILQEKHFQLALLVPDFVMLDLLVTLQCPIPKTFDTRKGEDSAISTLVWLHDKRLLPITSLQLYRAIRSGDQSLVKFLIEHECPISDTAFLEAATARRRNGWKMVQMMVDGGFLPTRQAFHTAFVKLAHKNLLQKLTKLADMVHGLVDLTTVEYAMATVQTSEKSGDSVKDWLLEFREKCIPPTSTCPYYSD